MRGMQKIRKSNPNGRILITSGPTQEPLDPVRFLSNASSGRMGVALAEAALNAGFDVTVVSGPVRVTYPDGAEVLHVTTTAEMLDASLCVFERPDCAGVIGAAAPCDFQVERAAEHKIRKRRDGVPIMISLVETPDILARLAAIRQPGQRIVGFALESEPHDGAGLDHALEKLRHKQCDLLVLNHPASIGADETTVTLIGTDGATLARITASKHTIANEILQRF